MKAYIKYLLTFAWNSFEMSAVLLRHGMTPRTERCSLIRTVICDSSVMAALVTDSLLGVYKMCSVEGLGKPT